MSTGAAATGPGTPPVHEGTPTTPPRGGAFGAEYKSYLPPKLRCRLTACGKEYDRADSDADAPDLYCSSDCEDDDAINHVEPESDAFSGPVTHPDGSLRYQQGEKVIARVSGAHGVVRDRYGKKVIVLFNDGDDNFTEDECLDADLLRDEPNTWQLQMQKEEVEFEARKERARRLARAKVDAEMAAEQSTGATWRPVDLDPYLRGEVKRPEPAIGLARRDGLHLLYPGKEHTVIGEMESGKSWVAAAARS